MKYFVILVLLLSSCVAVQNSNQTLCKPEQRNAQLCTADYTPVCGWFNQDIKCIKYPCAATYSNSCGACKDTKVEYWTLGECPK